MHLTIGNKDMDDVDVYIYTVLPACRLLMQTCMTLCNREYGYSLFLARNR